jgi:hypothetical protein
VTDLEEHGQMKKIGVCIEIFNVTNEAGTGDLIALFDKYIDLMALACGPGKERCGFQVCIHLMEGAPAYLVF